MGSLVLPKPWLTKPSPAHSHINWSHPLTQGLQACWLLGEGGGLKAFDSVGLYHGALTNMTTNPWVAGRNGKALNFDGTNDYISMGDVLSNETSKLSVSAWFYCKSFGASYQCVIVKGASAFEGRNYSFGINASAADQVWTEGITNDLAPVLSITLQTNLWYHFAGVRDVGGQGGVIYINGVKRYSDAGATVPSNTEILGIGFGEGGFAYFNGMIEDVRIWNRALLPSEVLQLYMEPYAIFIPPGPRLLTQSIVTGNSRLGDMNVMGF